MIIAYSNELVTEDERMGRITRPFIGEHDIIVSIWGTAELHHSQPFYLINSKHTHTYKTTTVTLTHALRVNHRVGRFYK